jgi:uncharacterized protein (DUF952 family)
MIDPPDFCCGYPVFHGGAVDIAVPFRQSAHLQQKPLHEAIMSVTPVVYKIVTEALWQEARQSGVFRGAGIDLKDNFIHLSTEKQVRQTVALFFAGQPGLLLIAIDSGKLGDKLIFEPSRDGDLFPHLYAELPLSAVIWERPLPLDDAGQHIFPEPLS